MNVEVEKREDQKKLITPDKLHQTVNPLKEYC